MLTIQEGGLVRDTKVDVDVRAVPLPICPTCHRLDTVYNEFKTPYPPRLRCSACQRDWGMPYPGEIPR